MRIQKPTITSVSVLSGDGASLTGSFSGSFIGWEGIGGKPDPLLSSSAQIASDISGSLSNTAIAALGAGIVSGSSQLASDISGSFTLVSASIASDIAGLDGNYATDAELNAATSSLSASLAVDISTKADKTAVSGAFTTTSASIATDIATNLSSINTLNSKTLVSGSAQIASNISGSFVQASSSIASDIDTIQANISSNDTDISGLNTYTSSLKTAITVSGADTTILGNLTVQGTQTQLQTATLNVEDLNITVASGSATAAAANGAGLTVAGAGATITYASTGDKWVLNKDLDLGSNNLVTTGNVDGRDVSADGTKLDGIESGATADQTAAEIRTLVESATDSNVFTDADHTKLDGIEAGADVTDATNVAAAGAVMDSDFSSNGFMKRTGAGTYTVDGNTYLTAHPTITAASSVNNSGRTYIQDITLDSNGHVTGITSATETVVDTNTTYTAGTNLNLTGTTFSIPTSTDMQIDSLGVGTAAPGTTGVIRATNDIVAYYSSDERLKDNIKPLEGALDKVNAMGGYEFDWNDNQEVHEGHDIGVIAQEVQAQYPELVHERDNGYLAVDYVKLTAVLLQAVKELSAKVDQLSK